MFKASNAPAAQPTTEWWRRATDPRYEVSSLGRLRRGTPGHGTYAGRILKPFLGDDGYLRADFTSAGRSRKTRVATEVAAAFIGPRPPGHEINHINGIKSDNRAENLEYVTPAGNMAHARRMGLLPKFAGETHGCAKLKVMQVRVIRRLRGILLQREVGELFGVKVRTVSHIQMGTRWRCVPRQPDDHAAEGP